MKLSISCFKIRLIFILKEIYDILIISILEHLDKYIGVQLINTVIASFQVF